MLRAIVLLSALVMSACATLPPQTEAEKAVKVHRGSFSLEGCKQVAELREVVPTTFDTVPRKHSEEALQRAAVKFGADTVIMTSGDVSFGETAYGTAYKCNK